MDTLQHSHERATRSSRLGLRATPEQEIMLRRAAEASHKSLTDFILDSACRSAQEALLDQRLFMVTAHQAATLLEMLEHPAEDNTGLQRLFAKPAPWHNP